jgi:ABC-type branched-subunit amino acid transport system substrate-binding protein
MVRLKAAVVLIALPIMFALSACGGDDDDSADGDEPLTIGMTVERTGALDVFAPAVDGAEAAVEYVNAQGGADGREVELIVRDNASDSTRAVQTYQELADAGASIIVGGLFSQNCAAIRPVAAREEVPNICLSPNDLDEAAPPYQYGVGAATRQLDVNVYEYLAQQADTVGTLVATDFSGEQATEWAEDGEQANDITVQVEETDVAATTFRPQLQKMEANGVEALYMSSCGPISITAAGEAVELGFEGRIILSNCFASQSVAKSIKGFANGNVMTLAPEFMLGPPYSEERQAANELYNDEVGTKDIIVADGWDAIFLAAAAAEQAGSVDPSAINEALEDDFEFFGAWAGGTFTPEDHRGQVDEGAQIPAVYTPQGDLERAEG